jgi:uncharacterized membrane protein
MSASRRQPRPDRPSFAEIPARQHVWAFFGAVPTVVGVVFWLVGGWPVWLCVGLVLLGVVLVAAALYRRGVWIKAEEVRRVAAVRQVMRQARWKK